VPDPLGVGVIGDGSVRLTPAGAVPTQDANNVTGELNPFCDNTLTVVAPLPPTASVTEGLDVIEKSGPLSVVLPSVVSFTSGPVTVKLAETEIPLGLLVAVIAYGPVVTFATTKEPDNSPLESEQSSEVTTLPESVQFASVDGKTEPETWTPAPTGAEVSFSDNDGEEFVTVKVCEAQSPAGIPVTVIV
jgi:hypothetical protein